MPPSVKEKVNASSPLILLITLKLREPAAAPDRKLRVDGALTKATYRSTGTPEPYLVTSSGTK